MLKPSKALSKNNLAKINDEDVFLCSYPRSGNTYVRLVLSDLIQQLDGQTTKTDNAIDFGYLIPTIPKHDFDLVDDVSPLSFRIIKTHKLKEINNNRFIYIFRNPLDSLRSYYRFIKKSLKIDSNDELKSFFDHYSTEWITHIEQVISRYKSSQIISLHSFEDLKSHPVNEFSRISNFLGFNVSEKMISVAIENQSIEKRRNLLIQQNVTSHQWNIGEGESGLGIDFFSSLDLGDKKNQLFSKYNQIQGLCEKQKVEHST